MYPLFDELIEEQRRKDRMAYADEMRKQALISPKRTFGDLFVAALLARLGSWLVTVGCRLQERYEAVSASSLEVYAPTESPTPNCTS